MTDPLDDYHETDDRNERYRLLRREIKRLRGEAESGDFFDREAVAGTVATLADEVEGSLLTFVANDFGLPVAYRPAGTDAERQDRVRRAILAGKYDGSNEDLDALRRRLLDAHPGVHKSIVAVIEGEDVRYHLPEGSNPETNFVTVREMVGLVDYVTNSAQDEGLSETY